jgi:hypothetical protein
VLDDERYASWVARTSGSNFTYGDIRGLQAGRVLMVPDVDYLSEQPF